jgi:hypothetical protein
VKNNRPFHEREFLFLSYLESSYSRSSVYLNSTVIQDRNPEFKQIDTGLRSSFKEIFGERKRLKNFKNVVVMSPSHSLVFLFVILTGKRPILDAGWSLTESTLIRSRGFRALSQVPKSYLIDLFAFHFSKKIFLESDEQINFIAKRFMVSKKKLFRLFTGVNEKLFESTWTKMKYDAKNSASMKNTFTVLFRGKNNEEAGLDCILSAAEILKNESINFLVVTDNFEKSENLPKNVQILTDRLSEAEMVGIYSRSDLCLGQMSDNARIERTIPHKAYEALYFSKCYLTLLSKPILELLPNVRQCAAVKIPAANELASEILRLSKSTAEVNVIGREGHHRFQKVASQEVLGSRFLEKCLE